jgi:ribonuclease-3
MGPLGLPALMRAVPARLFQWPPRPGSRGTNCAAPGTTLLELVSELPPELRRTALTHSSWVENRSESNERLEFLGDSVLGLAIASTLHRRYPEGEEGDLARLKAFVVSRASCAQVAERLDVCGLMTQEGAASDPRRATALRNPTILGNTLEALIGAVFLTYGFEQTRLAVVSAFEEQIVYAVTSYVDHKTALQERLALRGCYPAYKLVDESGPPHARIFTSEVNASGGLRGRGSGTTIKASEQAAAKEALAGLGETPPEV